MPKDRFDTPKTPVALDVTDLSNFAYDMSRCIKCKGCYWVEHTYMPGVRFSTRCPSNVWNDFDSYGAFGKMRIGTGRARRQAGVDAQAARDHLCRPPVRRLRRGLQEEPRPRDRADPGSLEGEGRQGRRRPDARPQEDGGEHREASTTSLARRPRTGRNGSPRTSRWPTRRTCSISPAAPHPTGTPRSPRRPRRYSTARARLSC